jgi:predicted ATPase/transcriptional regulator with XRE-family HTH domain
MTSDHGAGQGGPGFDVVLRSHRQRTKLTQQELADRAAIGVRTVRDLERGRASRPQRMTAELLATALGLAGTEREAFLAAARGQSSAGPPAPAVNRLPPAGDLIGRDADVAELADLLIEPAPYGPRGVTLVGLAGVGKSALAFFVAHRVAADYPGGVAGIVITDGNTAGEIIGGIAAAYGVGRPDDLSGWFAGASTLLLVDAVERAPDAVAEALSTLLARIPALRFIATGRHPVGLPAERIWPVAPLVAPPADAGSDLAGIQAYPAVTLFLDRLARVRRTPLEPEETAATAALVRRLGGLPLAIELAAARGRVLTVTEILDRYGDRVLDLSRSGSGATETVVSLRDAVAASYRLLNDAEQSALRRLAMFRYRWSLALAEQMVADGPTGGSDVVHLLDRLLELGLLSVRGSRAVRFRLLDVVRDYAAERAMAGGEVTAFRRRHAAVLADFAERIAPELAGGRMSEAAAKLDDVTGDLGAALTFAASEDPQTALRLAAALPRWWRFRFRDVTGRQWLRRLLDDPRTAEADPAVRAWAKVGLAQLASEHSAGVEEIAAATAALRDFEQLGDAAGQVTAHGQLAALWMSAGGYDEAREHAEMALTLARQASRVRDMALAEHALTWHELREGDLQAARRRLAEVERLAGRSGEHRLRAIAVGNLAEVARLEGKLEEAERLGRRAAAELEAVGHAPHHRRRVLATIGLAMAEAGRVDQAEAIEAELRPPPEDVAFAAIEGAVARRRGEFKRAADCYARAAELHEPGDDPRDLLMVLLGVVMNTPDPQTRRGSVQKLARLCREAGITLLPPERGLLTAEELQEFGF